MRAQIRLVTLCLALGGCRAARIPGGAGPVPVAASIRSAADHPPTEAIVGVWRVERFCFTDSLGRQHDPLGRASGYFIYTPTGYVSLQFGRAPGVAALPMDSLRGLGLPADAARGLADGHVAYFGRYTVESDSTLIHHVEGGSLPSYIGTDQHRAYRISGARHDTLAIGDVHPGCRVLVRVQ